MLFEHAWRFTWPIPEGNWHANSFTPVIPLFFSTGSRRFRPGRTAGCFEALHYCVGRPHPARRNEAVRRTLESFLNYTVGRFSAFNAGRAGPRLTESCGGTRTSFCANVAICVAPFHESIPLTRKEGGRADCRDQTQPNEREARVGTHERCEEAGANRRRSRGQTVLGKVGKG